MHSKAIRWLVALLILVLVLAATGWYKLLREVPQTPFSSPEALFKYGSIGSESSQGVPYWIWRVLPKIFPEYLPRAGGYAALGIPWERSEELPIGFSKKTIGFPRVAFNCALCHTASYRLKDNEAPTLVLAGPSHTVNAQGYARFLALAGNDPKFNSANILREIDLIYKLSWLDKLLYRYLIIPSTKKALIKAGQEFAWTENKPSWGPGRIDPFNPIKFGILKMGVDPTIGNSDMVPLWNMKIREGTALHWDGLNTDLHEVVISSAIGDGMTYKSVPKENLERLKQWLKDLPPPKSPFSASAEAGSP